MNEYIIYMLSSTRGNAMNRVGAPTCYRCISDDEGQATVQKRRLQGFTSIKAFSYVLWLYLSTLGSVL